LIPLSGTQTYENVATEIRAIRNLYTRDKSKYLVEILGYGRLDAYDYVFIDMELCGQPLDGFILGEIGFVQGKIESSRVQIMWEIASGIEFIHGCNAVHRDLKPSNSKTLSAMNQTDRSPVFDGRQGMEDSRFWSLFPPLWFQSGRRCRRVGNVWISEPRINRNWKFDRDVQQQVGYLGFGLYYLRTCDRQSSVFERFGKYSV
jgi:hypothetical protein